jgi:hypothetical protein
MLLFYFILNISYSMKGFATDHLDPSTLQRDQKE